MCLLDLSLTLALSTTLSGDAPALLPGEPHPPRARPAQRGRLLTDQCEDGTIWVRGDTYKLCIHAGGATFLPRERHAARTSTLELGIAELATDDRSIVLRADFAPELAGRRVTVDRGPVLEVWDLEPHGVRQSFVLRERSATRGDLVVRIPVGGDAQFDSDHAESGLLFRTPEGAVVHYGDVLSLDACEQSEASASVFRAGAIELRVSAAFLERAAYPLTIDPFIAQFAVDLGTDDPTNGDVAVDVSTGNVLTVSEDTFSSGDRDIISIRHDVNGFLLEEVAVDISNADTITPAVANYETANQFLIVWTNLGNGLFNTRKIEGRTRAAASLGQGSTKTYSFGQGDESDPDVGGPRNGSVENFYVVWTERSTTQGKNLRGRRVSATGNPGWVDIFAFPGDQTRPVINKSTSGAGRYMIVYQEPSNTGIVLKAHVMFSDGDPEGSLGVISSSGGVSGADVAGEDDEFLVVYQRSNSAAESDILATRISMGTSPIQVSFTNLSEDEPNSQAARHQFSPAVALTSNGFVYMYAESTTAQDFNSNMFAGALAPGLLNVQFLEGHVALFPSGVGIDSRPRIGSSPTVERAHAVWNYVDAAGDKDVRGAIYEVP